jgi:hypothetical protein
VIASWRDFFRQSGCRLLQLTWSSTVSRCNFVLYILYIMKALASTYICRATKMCLATAIK